MISPAYCFSWLPCVHVTVVMRMYINELHTHLAPNLALSVAFSLSCMRTLTLTHIHWSDLSTHLFTLPQITHFLLYSHLMFSGWVIMSRNVRGSLSHTSMIQSLEITMSLCCWFLEGVSTLHLAWSLSVLPLVVPAHLPNVYCNASGLCHQIILCILYIRHVIVHNNCWFL